MRGTDVPARGPGDPAVLLRTLIGQALRRLRLRQGRTLREVADAAQVSMPYLSEIERGRKEASSEVLAAICRALGVRLSDLLEHVRDDLLELEPARPAVRPAGFRAPVQPASGAVGTPTPTPRASMSIATTATAAATATTVAAAAVDLFDRTAGVGRVVPLSSPDPVRPVTRPYFDVRCQVAEAA